MMMLISKKDNLYNCCYQMQQNVLTNEKLVCTLNKKFWYSDKASVLFLNVFQFYLKLSYTIKKLFLFPAGFELWILPLAFDTETLTNALSIG